MTVQLPKLFFFDPHDTTACAPTRTRETAIAVLDAIADLPAWLGL
jgi:hypothetical protein